MWKLLHLIWHAVADILRAWRSHWATLFPRWLRRFLNSSSDEMVLGVHDFMALQPSGSPKDIIIRLSSDHVLCRCLQLPNASVRTLKRAASFELERLSAVPADRIVHDMSVIKRDPATGRATVELRLIRRDLLEHIAEQCRSLGLCIAGLRLPWPHDRGWSGYPVNRYAAARAFARRWAIAGLTAFALILAGCLVIIDYTRGAAIERRIAAEMETAQMRAAAIPALRENIEGARRQISFFVRERHATLSVVLLNELSGMLPDDAWATELEFSPDGIRIQGYARDPQKLIGILEKSRNFIDPHFRQPPTPNPTGAAERFDLSAHTTIPL